MYVITTFELRGGDKVTHFGLSFVGCRPMWARALYPLKPSVNVDSLVIFLILLLSYRNNWDASISFVPLVFIEMSKKKNIYLHTLL